MSNPDRLKAELRPGEKEVPSGCFVVVGCGNRVASEVRQEACAAAGVGVYRRCSGGGTVLQGPGCLNYSLILQIHGREELASITGTNHYIMERQRALVESLLRRAGDERAVRAEGHTDLAIDGRKFSGNAQRRRRRALLFHGTFLYRFDLALIGRLLAQPSRQPDYRQNRPHEVFVMNLPLAASGIKEGLAESWQADSPIGDWPEEQVKALAEEKYEQASWNFRF